VAVTDFTLMPRSFSIWARIGPQRRVISAAFSVDSSANVISLGQLGSAAPVGPAQPAIVKPAMNSQIMRFMDRPPCLDRRPPDAGGDHVGAHHHGDDQEDD